MKKYAPSKCQIKPVNPRTSAIHMWPARHHLVYDGWVLRLFHPNTHRSNCVYPLNNGRLNMLSKIKQCETVYQNKGFEFLFQVMPHEKKLDILLQASNYQKINLTRWMELCLVEKPEDPSCSTVIFHSKNDWLKHRQLIGDYSQKEAKIYQVFYQSIYVKKYPLSLSIDGIPISCGLGLQTNRFMGIFDVRTRMAYQRKGYAQLLVQKMIRKAYENGVNHVQLHVDIKNDTAIQLYQGLGFRKICDYWFRKKET